MRESRPVADDTSEAEGGVAAGAAVPLLAAAQLYYEDRLSQQQIAERLGISRSSVSRLLQLAREQGIVHIEVRPPTPPSTLSDELRESLGLRRAIVVPASRRDGDLHALVAPTLAEIERLHLRPGDVLAVSGGRTLWEIARARRFPPLDGVRVVPAIGGLDERDVFFQTNEISRRIAAASGAEVSFLHAPALPSPELRRSLLADGEVAARLALWDRLTAALVGIGTRPGDDAPSPAHVTGERPTLARAVGDVVSRYFDSEGRPVELAHEERLLGLSREQLRNAATVIAAAADPAKGESIVGAARAGLIDVLVTDAPTAAATLRELGGAG